MRKRSLFLVLALAVVMAFALVGCQKADSPAKPGDSKGAVEGGVMSYYIGEPAYIDPWNAQESEGMQVTQVLFDSLTDIDPLDPEKLLPAAATEWSANDEATVWTFKLNKDGVFSDGTPVTADDFVYAWNRIANPATKNTLTGEADPSVIAYHIGFVKGFNDVQDGNATEMEGLKAVDDYTLEVTLSEPFADFAYVVMHPALGPVPKAAVEGGVEFEGAKVAFGDMPIGNGPFKMAEPWKHDQYIKLVRNDEFKTGDLPYLDGIDFKIFKDPETAYTEFEAGNLDFSPIGEGKIKDAEAKYGTSEDGYTSNPGKQTILGAESAIYFLVLNTEDPVLKDANVRKAISLAINRQAICDIVFEGTREPADSIIPPGTTGYAAGAWEDSRYDVDAAKKALADAGFPDGEGLPEIELAFNSGGGHEKIMELVQADLKAIGIDTHFASSDFPVYLKMLDEGKHQVARLGWIADYPIGYNFLYSLFESNAGDNKSQYKNPEFDKGIVEAVRNLDDAARAEDFEELNRMLGKDTPVVPMMYYKHTRVGSDRINNFVYSPMGLGDFTKVWITPGK